MRSQEEKKTLSLHDEHSTERNKAMAAGPIVIGYKMAVTRACNDWNPLLSHDKSALSQAAVAAELVYFM